MPTSTRPGAALAVAVLVTLTSVWGCSPGSDDPAPGAPFGAVQVTLGPEGGVLEHAAARLIVPPGAVQSTEVFSLDDTLEAFVSPLGTSAGRAIAVRAPGGLQLPLELDLAVAKGVDLTSPATLRIVFRSTVDGALSQLEGVVDRSARVVRVRLLRAGDVQLALVTKATLLHLSSPTTQRFVVGTAAPQDQLASEPLGSSNWVRVAGDLPPGMFLDSRGSFSGLPSLAGRYPVGVTWDVAGTRGEAVFVLQVAHSVYPQAAVTQLDPVAVEEGERSFVLDVTGSDFVPGSQVVFGGTGLPTTYLAPYRLRARVPAELVAERGVRPVVVRNPLPGGGDGASLDFIVRAPTTAGVVAEISRVEPVSLRAGSTGVELTIYVTKRTFDAVVVLQTTAAGTFVVEPASSTGEWVRVLVPDALVAQQGDLNVLVRNSPSGNARDSLAWAVPVVAESTDGGTPDGGGSAPARNPVPAALEAAPATVEQWLPSARITVSGTGFTQETRFRINGREVQAEYASDTQVVVTMPAEFLLKTGSLTLYPENPPLGGGEGRGVRVEVVTPALPPSPAVTDVVPSAVRAPIAGKMLDVHGARFVEGARVVLGGVTLPTRRLSDTQLRAVLPPTPSLAEGPYLLSVVNPGTQPRTSEGFGVLVQGPGDDEPVLGPLGRSAVVRGVDARFSLAGAGFVPGVTRVVANGHVVSASFSNDRAGQVVLPAELTAQTDTVSLQVRDGDSGALSGQRSLQVVSRRVVLKQVTPSRIVAGSGAVPLRLSFEPGQEPLVTQPEVFVGARALRVVSALYGGQMMVELPGDLLASPAVLRLTVRDGGVTSNELLLGVDTGFDTGLPRLDAVEPATVPRNTAAQLTLRGALFPSAGQVLIGTRAFGFTTSDATTIRLQLPAYDLAVAGSLPVTVSLDSNVIGASSKDAKLVVSGSNPVPAVTSVTPSVIPTGSSDTSVELQGSNFLAGATSVFMGSQRLGVCPASGTVCRVVVPAALLAQAFSHTLVAQNPEPGGGWSTGAQLVVQSGNPVPQWGAFAYPLALPASATALNAVFPIRGLLAGTQVVGTTGVPLAIVGASPYALTVQVPPAQLTAGSTATFVARNDPPVGGSSPQQWMRVGTVPRVATVEPAVFPVGGAPVTVTLTGSGFQQGEAPYLRIDEGRTVMTTVESDGVLTATIPANALPATGFAELRVWFEGAFESNAVTVLAP